MASSSASPFSRARMMATLTTVQHTSALVFGSFLLVHLAAPSVAVVAPRGESIELATKTMILGRVYYQNIVSETLIVYGSLTIHVLASLVKRGMQLERTRRKRKASADKTQTGGYIIADDDDDGKQAPPTRTWASVSLHTLTGLFLVPAVFLHSYLNRIAPKSSSAPINELSPSELDYSYVTHGFLTPRRAWRYISWGLYTVLLCAGALHVVGGTDRIAKRMQARRAMKTRASTLPLQGSRKEMQEVDVRRKRQRAVAINAAVSLAGAAWLAVGLRRMTWEEDASTSTWMTKRLDACYAAVWPYSLAK